MEKKHRFSKAKLNYIRRVFDKCNSRSSGLNAPLALILNLGGDLFELPFSNDKIHRKKYQSQANGVGVFVIAENDEDEDFFYSSFWAQYHEDKVLQLPLDFLEQPIQTPFIFNLPWFFSRSLPAFSPDAPGKPDIEKCPECNAEKSRLTEVIMKRQRKLAYISGKEGVFEGGLESFGYQSSFVILAFRGDCGHCWSTVFKSVSDDCGMNICRFPMDRKIQNNNVIWKR